ncbi:MAG: protein kinase [Herpetosiphonaceae bacterium]|nr:protein kinase [Herpetosiphonaceae bacterium]
MSDLVGRTLGAYRIISQVGLGGMATVFKAFHPAMNRYVAIKVLPVHLARDASFRARFQRETHTIAGLEHRYILPVYDVGEDDGIPYLVMRYTEGGTMSDLLAAHNLGLDQAVRLVGQVAEALGYAHQRGIIHRDIKPANILIGPDGAALLSDFGIAKILEGTLNLTGEGMMIGTPFYMAPEQVRGQPADARSDIYALGVVLFESTTGQRPFMAETPLAVALMHIHDPLQLPRQINPLLPESLERVILHAMAKDPADRFQTAAEFAQALQELDQPISARPAVPAVPATVVLPETLAPAPAPPAARQGVSRYAPWLIGALLAIALVAVLLSRNTSSPTSVATSSPSLPAANAPSGLAAEVSQIVVRDEITWAATSGGLVRWGSDLQGQLFDTANYGFEDSDIQTVVAASDGTLWVGGGGVGHLRPTDNTLRMLAFYTHEDGLGTRVVRTLMQDSDGTIWAGGPPQENIPPISHFDGERWRTDELPMDAPELAGLNLNVRALFRASDGSLWVGLDTNGILRWDGAGWTHFGPDQGLALPANAEADVRIRRFAEDATGVLWAAASERGLLRFDPAAGRWIQVDVLGSGIIRGVARFPDNSLWVAGEDLVASSTNGGQDWALQGAADSNVGQDIGSLAQDGAGRVWAGAYDGGVSVFDGTSWRPLQR